MTRGWAGAARRALLAASVASSLAAVPARSSFGTQLVLDTRDDFCGYLLSRHIVGLSRGGAFEVGLGWDAETLALDPSGFWLAADRYPNVVVVNLVDGRMRTFRGDGSLQFSLRNSILLKSGERRSSLIQNGRFIARFRRSFSSVAPDGDAVAGYDRRGHVLVATRSRGWRARRLTAGDVQTSSWSPHGRTLAYDTPGNDGAVLRLVRMRSLRARAVRLPHGDVESISWSPDARWLAVDVARSGHHGRTIVVSARSASLQATLRGAFASWTPDGELTLWRGSHTRVVSPSGRVRWHSRITPGTWSPDGRWLLGALPRSHSHVWAISERGSRTVRIVRVHGRPLAGGWSSVLWEAGGAAVLTGGRAGEGVFVASPWTATAWRIAGVEDVPELLGFIHASPGVLALMHDRLRAPRVRAADC